eukprot:m.30757 g.30757  ORF g.30757 m.30757 type:complete len:110 (-) comp13899_c0_seq4:678-1007(-)
MCLPLFALSMAVAVAAQSPEFNYVTCGSSLKLAHVRTGARLHSHEVKYGSNGGSSGQNSITAVSTQIDPNSMWKVVAASGAADCASGELIPCGSQIRLKYVMVVDLFDS